MDIYFLQLQMWISCIAACVHSLTWHCGKPSVSVSPTHSHQEAVRASYPQPAHLQAEQSQLLQPFFLHSALLPGPARITLLGSIQYLSLSIFWSAPNWAQCSRCSLSSAKEWGCWIAAFSSTPVESSLQLGFVVLVTTWSSCQDIFWTAQSLKMTAKIVR